MLSGHRHPCVRPASCSAASASQTRWAKSSLRSVGKRSTTRSAAVPRAVEVRDERVDVLEHAADVVHARRSGERHQRLGRADHPIALGGGAAGVDDGQKHPLSVLVLSFPDAHERSLHRLLEQPHLEQACGLEGAHVLGGGAGGGGNRSDPRAHRLALPSLCHEQASCSGETVASTKPSKPSLRPKLSRPSKSRMQVPALALRPKPPPPVPVKQPLAAPPENPRPRGPVPAPMSTSDAKGAR